ncbi:MAG TPA: alpha/beta fold hydrolase, partial [Candidatus Dormibacteraeota bacterium]|nr:alpha/beta fold hydrolase [Candidatus Dormibacteraeota bacterium]
MAQTVATEGGRLLTFAEWGAHDGVPIFSMHGTPGCRLPSRRRIENGWAAVLDELGVRVITHDRPGYGGSDRQPGRSVADTAADVAAIAGALGIDRFAVEGGSSGSAHALAVAAQLGSRVRRVAVTAPMAPYVVLGPVEWSAGQDAEVQSYVAACLQ